MRFSCKTVTVLVSARPTVASSNLSFRLVSLKIMRFHNCQALLLQMVSIFFFFLFTVTHLKFLHNISSRRIIIIRESLSCSQPPRLNVCPHSIFVKNEIVYYVLSRYLWIQKLIKSHLAKGFKNWHLWHHVFFIFF